MNKTLRLSILVFALTSFFACEALAQLPPRQSPPRIGSGAGAWPIKDFGDNITGVAAWMEDKDGNWEVWYFGRYNGPFAFFMDVEMEAKDIEVIEHRGYGPAQVALSCYLGLFYGCFIGPNVATGTIYEVHWKGKWPTGGPGKNGEILPLPSFDITFTANTNPDGLDHGFTVTLVHSTAPGTVSGFKYNDLNGNGIRDEVIIDNVPTLEPGLEGWTIQIEGGGTTTTGPDGSYSFAEVPNGPQTVKEIPQPGWNPSPDAASASVDVIIDPGEDQKVDFGNVQTGDLIVIKYEDNNGNGQFDEGEPTLPGWEITVGEQTQITGSGGDAMFTGLALGSHDVFETMQEGWVATTGNPTTVLIEAGTGLPGETAQILFIGNFRYGEIHGIKYRDENGNGQVDAPDRPEPGWMIACSGNAGPCSPTEMSTNSSGEYWFTDLPPGTYLIFEATRPDWMPSNPSSGQHSVEIVSGSVITGLDFFNKPPPPPQNPGSIHAQKWLDINGDGVRDAGEPGLNGVTITLNGPGGPMNMATHDMNMDLDPAIDPITERGLVWFNNLAPGNYTLSENVPANMRQTAPAGNSIVINLAQGQIAEGHFFGNQYDQETDLGDAPNNFDPERPEFPGGYPTLLLNNGAIHLINEDVFLNKLIDAESDGQPTIPADGDDENTVDDEGGVLFGDGFVSFSLPLGGDPSDLTNVPGTLPGGTVEIRVLPSTEGRLDAWIDFNGDGDWEDAGERIADRLEVAPPFTIFSVNVPGDARIGFTYSRFRFSTIGVDSFDGLAPDGEVEDYLLVFVKHFSLNSVDDTGDAVPGDGICDDGTGNCTLRAFIQESNAGNQPAALITGSGKRGAVVLLPQSAYPPITASIVLAGERETEIDGSQAGADANGFTIEGSGVSILGFEIFNFSGSGVHIDGDNHSLSRNVIRNNTRNGVTVASGNGTMLTENVIYNNSLLGIDLGGDGVTPNDIGDTDDGANRLQNRPELTVATSENRTIEGLYSSLPGETYIIEFFSSIACDNSGSGEGRVFLGSTVVETDGTGMADYSIVVPVDVAIGASITATATSTGDERNTSEFSECLAAISTSIERVTDVEVPQDFTLRQNYPNPFNPVTTIAFGLSRAEFVTIEVFDLLGKRIELLVNERKEPGEYTVTFDGGLLPSGIYLYRMTAGTFTSSKQLTLLK